MTVSHARRRRAVRMLVVTVVLLAIAIAAWRWRRMHTPSTTVRPARAALPRTVKVEVLNSGKVTGAARVGTILLRHAGLDVTYYGDAGPLLSDRAHNQVLVRRGDTTGAGRVIEALGSADIVDAPDPSRLVDLTVLLGKDFSPPAIRP